MVGGHIFKNVYFLRLEKDKTVITVVANITFLCDLTMSFTTREEHLSKCFHPFNGHIAIRMFMLSSD